MKKLQELGRVLTNSERSSINGGGVKGCGFRCSSTDTRECCKPCGAGGLKYCKVSIEVPNILGY